MGNRCHFSSRRFTGLKNSLVKCHLETADSLSPDSAGSRSPRLRCRGVDVASTASVQPFFACGVLILLNCRHGLCCTAEWWGRECTGEAGRSRPRQRRASGSGSTSFHQTRLDSVELNIHSKLPASATTTARLCGTYDPEVATDR